MIGTRGSILRISSDRVEAAHARQPDVEQHEVRRVRLQHLEAFLGRLPERDGVALPAQRLVQEELHLLVVVDHQDMEHTGTVKPHHVVAVNAPPGSRRSAACTGTRTRSPDGAENTTAPFSMSATV